MIRWKQSGRYASKTATHYMDDNDERGGLKPLVEGIVIVLLAAAMMVVLIAVQQIIFRDQIVFVAAMFVPLMVLAVVCSQISDDNPLRGVLKGLSYRIGATATAAAVAIPIESISGLDVIYDIAAPLVLIWYWFTLFRDTIRTPNAKSGSSGPPETETRINDDVH
jgi:Na+/glutamate symporter